MGFIGGNLWEVKVVDLSLRVFVIPLSIASIWITVSNRQDNADYGELDFHQLLGLKYMVWVSGIAAAYALFAALSSSFRCFFSKPWLFFITDQVLAYLMVTSMAALAEFLYLTYNGDQVISWSQVCVSYAKFCTRLKLAFILHLVAASCFLLLALISAYRLFTKFDPPFLPFKEDSQDRT